MRKTNQGYFVSGTEELAAIFTLINQIKLDQWLDGTTILVNCAPQFTSITAQHLNHALSAANNLQLFEVLNLELPTTVQSQVWNAETAEYLSFDKYLIQWIYKYIAPHQKYLFISNVAEPVLSKVRSRVKIKLEDERFRFATVYKPAGGFKADYNVAEYDPEHGLPVFHWEHPGNFKPTL
jgi:hypothetical protein